MMDRDVSELIERSRIIDVINVLFVGTDLKDWAAVKGCLAPEVHMDMTSLAGGKPLVMKADDVVAGWQAGLGKIDAVHHQAGNYSVTIRNDQADAFCYGVAWHYRPNATGQNTRTFVGSYDFHLVKKSDQWLIDLFRFRLKFIEGNRDLEG